jgi:hypothetical protein
MEEFGMVNNGRRKRGNTEININGANTKMAPVQYTQGSGGSLADFIFGRCAR